MMLKNSLAHNCIQNPSLLVASTRVSPAMRCPLSLQKTRPSGPKLTNSLQQKQLGSTRKLLLLHASASPSPEPGNDNVELELKVEGMMCEGCTSRVTEVLQKCDSVARVEVSLEKGSAAVWVNSTSQLEALDLAPSLAAAVQAVGFECQPHIEGL